MLTIPKNGAIGQKIPKNPISDYEDWINRQTKERIMGNLFQWVGTHISEVVASRLERDNAQIEQRNQAIAQFRANVPAEILRGLGFNPEHEPDVENGKAWMERAIDDQYGTGIVISASENGYSVLFGSTRYSATGSTGTIMHGNDEACIAVAYNRYCESVVIAEVTDARQFALDLVATLGNGNWDDKQEEWQAFLAGDYSHEAKAQAKEVFAEHLWRLAQGAAEAGVLEAARTKADEIESANIAF